MDYRLPSHVKQRVLEETGGQPVFRWQYECVLRKVSPWHYFWQKVRWLIRHWTPTEICRRYKNAHLWETAMTHREEDDGV